MHFSRRAGWLEEFTAELWLSPGAMTTRSMPSSKASPGAVTDAVRFLVDTSQGFTEAWPVMSDGIFGRDSQRTGDALDCGKHLGGVSLDGATSFVKCRVEFISTLGFYFYPGIFWPPPSPMTMSVVNPATASC